jgi:GAF domain-containing protein
MQGKLKALNDEEQKRKWSNEGLAKFVDILRSSDDNINVLGDNIISALVKYTGSNQGGLYILNDENERNKHLELVSLFAFDLKKFEKQQVKLGEGILGQTFLERETTYLNEIPEEYIRITSGLGDATPKTILMVPLKVDTEVYGIVELASFREFQSHEIAFVEKLGETIASTLASVKSAQKNRQLIEQFQTQTEQMKAQEEEMRQNMEELQATQEEIARKEREYIARIQVLESEAGNDQNRNELIEIQDKLSRQEQEYQSVIQEMENKLQEKPAKGDDWALATQVEKELKINLEALKITRQEWDSKTTTKK